MISYQEETFKEIIPEIGPLLKKHWEEVEDYKEKISLDPDLSQYEVLDQNNMLHIITARDGNKLIGYFITILVKDFHCKNLLMANADIYFLDPEYRKTLAGYHLIKFAVQELEKTDASVLYIHEKKEHSVSSIMKRLGLKHKENTYTKYIGE